MTAYCTCTPLSSGSPWEPPEWEQDPNCPVHPMQRWRHGTLYGYGVKRCRCSECRRVKVAAELDQRARRRPLPEGDRRHGTTNGYTNYRCRCADCTAANTARARAARTIARKED